MPRSRIEPAEPVSLFLQPWTHRRRLDRRCFRTDETCGIETEELWGRRHTYYLGCVPRRRRTREHAAYITLRNIHKSQQAQSCLLLTPVHLGLLCWILLCALTKAKLSLPLKCCLLRARLGLRVPQPLLFSPVVVFVVTSPNLHVDINSLRSLTELMNADYASWYSAPCRSGYTCMYTCVWADA